MIRKSITWQKMKEYLDADASHEIILVENAPLKYIVYIEVGPFLIDAIVKKNTPPGTNFENQYKDTAKIVIARQ